MQSDDKQVSDEELERRMTAKLFGGNTCSVRVETRRSGRKLPPMVEVEAKPIPLQEGGDDAFVYVFKAVLANGTRIHLKSIRGPASNDPEETIEEYEAEGRVVRWVGKHPEEYEADA